MQKVRTSKGEIKRAMYLHNPSIEVLEIQGEEKELYPPYLVKVRGYEIDFLYDGEQFFVDESDAQADEKLLTEHMEEAKKMGEDGIAEEEIKKHFAGKGVSHIKRCVYNLNSNLDIKSIVNDLITSL
ncbi:MAG TPA: hypothetical protein PLW93_03105 [Candidatus Absconditabacterales bacterium]|nr:hypothetical protein [Candidatus Absconditabacterales bacterium]